MGTDGWYGRSAGGPSSKCEGAVTYIWTWSGPDPAPAQVVLKVESYASWGGAPGGKCSAGIDGAAYTSSYTGGVSQGTIYLIVPVSYGQVNFSLEPTASDNGGAVGARVRATITPVSIESNFAVRTGDAFNFLVGQQADFYVSAGGYQLSGHQWLSGGSCVADVTVNLSTESYRQTTRDNGQFIQPHPSWYYDGEEHQGTVNCTVTIKDGNTTIGTPTISRSIYVYRPIISISKSATSPTTIQDETRGVRNDKERASASVASVLLPGMVFEAKVKLPPLFVQAQGLGQWSYSQLCAYNHQVTVSSPPSTTTYSSPEGLDGFYPYLYCTLVPVSYPMEIQNWCDTTWAYTLHFEDSPDVQVTGKDTVSMSFAAKTFMVLRPPVYSGQSRIDVPFKKALWQVDIQSSRSSSGDWQNVGSYNSTPSGNWETFPNGSGIQLTSPMQDDLYCEDMDWHLLIQ